MNEEIDSGEPIYQENDTDSVGNDTFGDRLTALTVRNNGTLPDDEIAEISLLANGTEIATATTPTDGTWVLNPTPETAWFGPPGNETTFSLHTTVTENATDGETVELWIPQVNDTRIDGVYDPGDTGLFFEQDSPTGDLGPGPTLTVENDSTENNTSDSDTNTTDTSDSDTNTTDTSDSDTNTTDTSDSDTNTTDTSDSDTNTTDTSDSDANTTDTSDSDTNTTDTSVTNSSDQTPSTTNTSIANSAGTNASSGNASSTNASSTNASGTNTSEPVAITVTLAAEDLTTDADSIPVSIDANVSDIDLRAELLRTVNNSTVATQWVHVDDDGTTTVSFEPRPGRFRVRVVETRSGSVGLSRPFEVRRPAVVSFENASYTVPRGEVLDLGVRFDGAANATLRLRGPTGESLVAVPVSRPDGETRVTVELDTYAAGRDIPEPGIRTPGTPDDVDPTGQPANRTGSGMGAANASGAESGPRSDSSNTSEKQGERGKHRTAGQAAGRGSKPDPAVAALGAGVYDLSLESGGTVTDNASLRVTAEWSGSVETMVLPAGANLSEGSRVEEMATSRREIAVGDTLVLAVETEGLGSYTRQLTPASSVGHPRDPNGQADPPGEAFVGLRQRTKTPNRKNSLAGGTLRRVGENSPGRVIFAARTAENGTDLVRAGERYGASLTLTEGSPFVPGQGNPESVESESVETNLTVVPARATVAAVGSNETLDVRPVPKVPVAGNTTVAPGTVATIRLNGTSGEDPYEVESETTIADDGTYDTTVDLSGAEPGTEYTISVSANGERISPLRTGQVIEAETESYQAAGGSGGGSGAGAGVGPGGGSGDGSDDDDRDGEVVTTTTDLDTTRTATGTPTSGVRDSQIDIERIEDLKRAVWNRLPEPIRLGLEAIILAVLGLLALVMVLLGIRRLL